MIFFNKWMLKISAISKIKMFGKSTHKLIIYGNILLTCFCCPKGVEIKY